MSCAWRSAVRGSRGALVALTCCEGARGGGNCAVAPFPAGTDGAFVGVTGLQMSFQASPLRLAVVSLIFCSYASAVALSVSLTVAGGLTLDGTDGAPGVNVEDAEA